MKLPTVQVVEVHYWAVLIKDEYRPDGEEYPERYCTKPEAYKKAQRLVDKQLAAPEGCDVEL